MDASEIGRVVAAARRRHGLTQQDLAELAGLHRPYVSELERGKSTKHVERLTGLLDVLGMELVVRDRRERTAFAPDRPDG